jgi:hypothetical protein
MLDSISTFTAYLEVMLHLSSQVYKRVATASILSLCDQPLLKGVKCFGMSKEYYSHMEILILRWGGGGVALHMLIST